jgi:hypothetical protein
MKKYLLAAAAALALGGSANASCLQPDENDLRSHHCYTNRDGYSVHGPSSTYNDLPPLGTTAPCADGTYSYSQHRRGTCSHHGGVAF